MGRRRVAVVLLIPAPVSIEIDGLRRALGDHQLGRVDAHVTIIPPINLRDDELADALAVVSAAAAQFKPMALTLGPVTTFEAESPVRFLDVTPTDPVTRLWDACWQGPFDRPERRAFWPHVTIDIAGSPTDGAEDPAKDLLSGYVVDVLVDRVTVLEQEQDADGRRWVEYLSYRFG